MDGIATVKHFQVYVLIAVSIVLAYIGLVYHLEQENTQQHEQTFNDGQTRQLQAAVAILEQRHSSLTNTFTLLADYGIPGYLSGLISQDLLEQLITMIAQDTTGERLAIGYFDAPGSVDTLFTKPSETGQLASDLLAGWVETYWDTVAASGQPVTTPIIATPQYQLYGLLIPVKPPFTQTITGILGVGLDYGPVIARYIAPLRSGQHGAGWLHDSTGQVIYDHEPPEIGRNILELSEPYPDLRRVFEATLTQESGQGEYHYPIELGGEVARKLVAWETAYLGHQRLTVAMSAPDSEVNEELAAFRQQAFILGGLLGVALIASGSLVYLTRQRALQQLVADHTRELEAANAQLTALTGSLERRVARRTEELEHERAQLAAILDTMRDGLIYHENGRVKYVNRAFCELLGYSAEESIGQDPAIQRQAVTSPEEYARLRQRYEYYARSGATIWREEVRLRRKNGQEFDAALISAQVRNAQGQVIGGVEIIRDISEEKALQAQKDSFITNASHELRRPLANLKARLYLLKQQPERLAEHVGKIERAVDAMALLVQALVDVSQLQRSGVTLVPRPITLQDVLAQALDRSRPTAARRKITLRSAWVETPITVTGDYQWLTESLGYVVSHALLLAEAEATLTIRLIPPANESAREATITLTGVGRHLEPDALAHVFEPFAAPSEGDVPNTGLELTIARQVIVQHGGTITIESDSSRGTIYTICLPVERAPEDQTK